MNETTPLCGFLLTRHQFDKFGQCFFEFWVKTVNGPVKMTTAPQRPVCFVRHEDADKLKSLLSKEQIDGDIQPIDLQTFNREPCLAVYCHSLKHYYQLRQAAKQNSISLLEQDIKPVDRFLMERFIQGNLAFIGEQKESPCSFSVFANGQIKAQDSGAELQYSTLSVDIECDEHGYLFSVGFHFVCGEKEHSKVLYNCAKIDPNTQLKDKDYIEWLEGESDLLQRSNQLIAEFDPDFIIGWNFVQFDIRVLTQAAKRNKVSLIWGRDGSELLFSDGQSGNEQRYPDKAYAAGRVLLDGIEVMRNATYAFKSFSLNNVAREVLGDEKLITEQKGLDKLAEIKRQYKYEPNALAAYNLQDCKLVSRIFIKEKLIDFLLTRTKLTGLELDRVGGSVAAFTNLYLPKIHRKGWVAPNLVAPEDYVNSPGGFVMDSKPGLHKNVLVFDFKSLYPSIMRTFNVDPIALVEAQVLPEDQQIPGFRGGVFSREKSILSDILDELWQARDKAKRQNNQVWSNAIKIIMNSFYGVLGSAGCRFYDTKLASSITMRGHWVLQESKYWFEDKGLEVIYGDTDSIFVCLDGVDGDKVDGKVIQQELNKWWTDRLHNEFKLSSKLEMEYETHYQPFFMPTIRGTDAGSKKRYAGQKLDQHGNKEIIFKGLENVRSDWTELAKRFQLELFKRVFSRRSCKNYVEDTLKNLRNGNFDEHLVYRKRIRQPLESYIKTTPPHIKAARRANESGAYPQYRKGSSINYVISTKGPVVAEDNQFPLDYEHYAERQIFPIAESILEIYSPGDLVAFDRQYSLI